MDLDDLSSKMVVLQPLIDFKSRSGRTVIEHCRPLRLKELCFIILLKFVSVDQYNPSS